MGMSYADFFRMTPDEFEAAAGAWRELRKQESRERWELMRLEATILIQPHVKERLTPKRLLPFSWDEEKEDDDKPEEELTAGERRQRAEEARRKWG